MGSDKHRRPALLSLNHSLANGNTLSTRTKLSPALSLQEKITYLYEHQQITDLLNEYAYQLDFLMNEPHGAEGAWQELFTEDCVVTYPFGTHQGREGLGKWALAAESRFFRMQHSSSNVTIQIYSSDGNDAPTKASGRNTLIAFCGVDEYDIGKTFSEGGYYYWDFRKSESGEWKISRLVLDILWTAGDDLGLNDTNGEGGNYPTPEEGKVE